MANEDESISIHHIYKYGKWEELERHAEDLLSMLATRTVMLKYDQKTMPVPMMYSDEDETVEMTVGDIECEIEVLGDRLYDLSRLNFKEEEHRG